MLFASKSVMVFPKSTFQLCFLPQEKGNYNAQWWSHEILDALEHEEEKADPTQRWEKVHMRQMSGIIIYAFARSKFQPYIGNLSSSSVGTGVMGFGGNKGAVAVAFTLYRRRIVVVCSHFAAHQVSNVHPRWLYLWTSRPLVLLLCSIH